MSDRKDDAGAAPDNPAQPGQEGKRDVPEARSRGRLGAGWIWAIPIAALMFVGWLAVKTWLFQAPEVTVHFDNVAGINSDAAVRYRGAQVGRVTNIRLADDLGGVEVTLSLEGWMDGHLGSETAFWIVQPSPGQGGITNLLEGAYIGIQPAGDGMARTFEGLEDPPIALFDEPGRHFVLTAADAGGISREAPVLFHGIQAGRVLGIRYREEEGRVDIHVAVRQEYAKFVKKGTVFWQAGGLSVSTGASGLDVELPSLSALTGGAIAFSTPDVFGGEVAETDAVFPLHDSRAKAMGASKGPRLAYFVRLPESAGELEEGAPVQLEGRTVGRVSRVGFEVDADSGSFATPVWIELEVRKFGLEPAEAKSAEDLRSRMDALLGRLVTSGLRARAVQSGLVLGGKAVELAVLKDSAPASFDPEHRPPAIPGVSGSGGLQDVIASIDQVAGKIGELPLSEIARNLRDASARIKAVATSPKIDESLESLETALANVETMTQTAKGEVKPIVNNLSEAAKSVRSAADSLEGLAGGPPRQGRDLPELISELTEAAQAINTLASYLSRHPEAVIKGRQ